MSFLKRLSDGFWSLVSSSKPNATKQAPTPLTLPRVKPKRSVGRPRKSNVEDVLDRSRSMSPVSRVDSWRLTASEASSSRKRKRVAPITPSTGVGRRSKIAKMEDIDMDYTPDIEYNNDELVMEGIEHEQGFDQEELLETDVEDDSRDNVRIRKPWSRFSRSPSPGGIEELEGSDPEIDDTIVVSEEEYNRNSPNRKVKIISPTTAEFSRGVDTSDLRAQGWDDDHVTLVQRIAMRGFEPLLPAYHKFALRWLPDALFEESDDAGRTAFISSVRGDDVGALRALEKLFELGSWVRDRVLLDGRVKPHQQVRKAMKEYMKWAEEDSGLDRRTMIPMLALECQSEDVPVWKIQENAKRKLARLAARYREAFRVNQSIEGSPTSRTSTVLAYPVPTLYAIIASHTLIALVAYRPEDEDPDIKSVAFFDMKDKGYDVWNALALATAVCHVRNVQKRIANETGIGLKSADYVESETDDPDA